jgi:ankyrin repeat protein
MGIPFGPSHNQHSASYRTSSLRAEDLQNLREIAQTRGYGQKQRLQQFSHPAKPDFIESYEKDAVYKEARSYLVQLKLQRNNGKAPSKSMKTLFRSSKNNAEDDYKHWDFDLNERADALDTVISRILNSSDVQEQESQLRLAQALIDNEHTDVAIRNWTITRSKFTKKIESAIPGPPSDWLQEAAGNNKIALVNLLASRLIPELRYAGSLDNLGGQQHHILNDALKLALSRTHNAEVIKSLLCYGADPNTVVEVVETAVESGNRELVQLLLQSSIQLDLAHISTALVHATRVNDRDLVPLLLAYGADCNENKALALCCAVEAKNVGAIAAILSFGCGDVQAYNLDRAVGLILRSNCQRQDMQLILSMLLQAGASRNTPDLQVALARVVQNNDEELAKLLVSYDTSPDRNDGEAITLAVQSLSLDLLDTLLKGNISEQSATEAVNKIPVNASEAQVERILSALIIYRPSNLALGNVILSAVKRNWVLLVKWLVEHNAAIQYQAPNSSQPSEFS